MKNNSKPQNQVQPGAKERVEYTVGASSSVTSLENSLCETLDISKASARASIFKGLVFVDGRANRDPKRLVKPNSKVQAFIFRDKNPPSQKNQLFELTESLILFEDEGLIAVNKPCHLPTQQTLDPNRPYLYDSVKKYLLKRGGLQGGQEPYVGLHHRLDRDTSGVVLFTKSKDLNPGVAELFSKHLIQKTYLALSFHKQGLVPLPKNRFEIKNRLGIVKVEKKQKKFGQVKAGGDSAHTVFETLAVEKGGVAAFLAKPQTGRTHQIRVHLSEMGFPLLGDPFYGGKTEIAGKALQRHLLHALSLEFIHPKTQKKLLIEAKVPDDEFQWALSLFQNLKGSF